MIIKPSTENIALTIIFLTLIVAFSFLLGFLGFWIAIIIFWCFSLPFIIRTTVLYLTTIEFSKDGCDLKFWFIKKHFKWNELKTIRIEDLRACFPPERNYDKCLIFSKKDSVRPYTFLTPMNRTVLFGGFFNTFYVHFLRKGENYKKGYNFFAVDEEEMLAKLKEWGVEPEFRVYNY